MGMAFMVWEFRLERLELRFVGGLLFTLLPKEDVLGDELGDVLGDEDDGLDEFGVLPEALDELLLPALPVFPLCRCGGCLGADRSLPNIGFLQKVVTAPFAAAAILPSHKRFPPQLRWGLCRAGFSGVNDDSLAGFGPVRLRPRPALGVGAALGIVQRLL